VIARQCSLLDVFDTAQEIPASQEPEPEVTASADLSSESKTAGGYMAADVPPAPQGASESSSDMASSIKGVAGAAATLAAMAHEHVIKIANPQEVAQQPAPVRAEQESGDDQSKMASVALASSAASHVDQETAAEVPNGRTSTPSSNDARTLEPTANGTGDTSQAPVAE